MRERERERDLKSLNITVWPWMRVLIGQTLLIFFFVADGISLLDEELPGLCSLKGQTTGEETADKVNKTGMCMKRTIEARSCNHCCSGKQ
jgi:hypothetical protein